MFALASSRHRAIFAIAAIAGTTAATAAVPGARAVWHPQLKQVAAQTLRRDVAPQGYSGSAEYYILGAENGSSSYPYNVYCIEGFTPNDTGGVGVLGYSGSPGNTSVTNGYGVYGVTFAPSGIGVYGSGNGPAPAGTSPPSASMMSTGVVGDSHSGYGVYGTTEFPNASGTIIPAGVYGLDNTTAGNDNSGVIGQTTNGGFGVEGLSADSGGTSAIGGVYGSATSGTGVFGTSSSGQGGFFTSSSNNGVTAESGSGDGILAQSNSGTAGVYAESSGTADALDAVNDSTGYALYAQGNASNFVGVVVNGNSSGGKGLYSEAEYIGLDAASATYPLNLQNGSGDDEFYVNASGDVYYAGSLNTFARTRNGYVASSFTPRASTPTIEDTGGGRIVGGSGAVRLDPALIEAMDRSTAYRVFLTPDGDTRGLYVASKTPEGFIVRETQGGRGTLDFDYRIVATVDGQSTRRMTLARTIPSPSSALVHRSARHRAALPQRSPKIAAFMKSLAQRGTSPAYVPRPNLAVEHRSL